MDNIRNQLVAFLMLLYNFSEIIQYPVIRPFSIIGNVCFLTGLIPNFSKGHCTFILVFIKWWERRDLNPQSVKL